MTPLGTGRETPLSELLGKAREFVCRFVVFGDEHAADAVCLWIAHTHALAAAEHTPYLIVSSPVKRCGKSRLMEVIEPLVRDPWALSAAPTEAVMFRRIDAHESTVLIDEVDRMFEGSKESVAPMTALLNGGYRRGAVVARCEGSSFTPRDYKVFSPKVLAGINADRWPDTLLDRSIRINLRRKSKGELPNGRFRRRDAEPEAALLNERLAEWSQGAIDELAAMRPDEPSGLSDRAFDVWEPLLAIADQAGGDWPARARSAALALSGENEIDDESVDIYLLSQIQIAFDEAGEEKLSSSALLSALNRVDVAPWASWNGGSGLDARSLANRMKTFGVKSKDHRMSDGAVLKGYSRSQFADAWERYLPSPPEISRNSATSPISTDSNGSSNDAPIESSSGVGPSSQQPCSGVADDSPPERRLSGDEFAEALLADSELQAVELEPGQLSFAGLEWSFGGRDADRGERKS